MRARKHAHTDRAILRIAQDKLPRLLMELVGAVGRWFHFACGCGRGRCAMAFPVMLFASRLTLHSKGSIVVV